MKIGSHLGGADRAFRPYLARLSDRSLPDWYRRVTDWREMPISRANVDSGIPSSSTKARITSDLKAPTACS